MANLGDLEIAENVAYQSFAEAYGNKEAADTRLAEAQEAYDAAMQDYYYFDASPENEQKLVEATQALEDARVAQEEAEAAFEQTAAEAQAAAEAAEAEREALRESRATDTTYVVHCARVECTHGMRESYLALGPTHGVKTRQIAQMVASDTVLDTNIINFGGCNSVENPKVREAAEQVAEQANQTIADNWGFRDWVLSLFTTDSEIRVTESLMEKCFGECIANFPSGKEWEESHEKVFINGKAVLLRKCSLTCNYGGLITILFSGQPE